MHLCYLDESGGCERPDQGPSATPVVVILGLIIDAAVVPAITRDFLALKRRQAHVFRSDLLDLLKRYGCRIVGRVWIKEPGKSMKVTESYCYAVQDISLHFSQFMLAARSHGVLIADGRTPRQNVEVAHSIFTQKWRTGGDPFPPMVEVPLFANSNNHVGLQLADLVASTLVFPMAAAGFCPPNRGLAHASPRYADVTTPHGQALKDLQFRYRDETGRWRGGLVVSDPAGKRPGSALFAQPRRANLI